MSRGDGGVGGRVISRAAQSLQRCLGRGMSTSAEMGCDDDDRNASFVVTA